MRLDEVLSQPLLDMAYYKAKAESIITALEDQINVHLLKLLAVSDDSRADAHWRHELVTWLTKIARIRLKPAGKPASADFYYRILFDEPYGGSEISNVTVQLGLLRRNYPLKGDTDPASVVQSLTAFHKAFAEACSFGTLDDTGVTAMIAAFPTAPAPAPAQDAFKRR